MTEKVVEIYADGACKGNPGPGGWGVLLRAGGREREMCGGEAQTTNNRMELTAVIEGLLSLKERSQVRVYTDSQYVQKGISEWIHGWKTARLADRGQEAGQERRSLEAAGRDFARARRRMALGERPRGASRERARRRAGEQGDRHWRLDRSCSTRRPPA